MKKLLYIGLDVHEETITIATADEGRQAAREFKTIPSDYSRLLKAVRLLTPKGAALRCATRPAPPDTVFIDSKLTFSPPGGGIHGGETVRGNPYRTLVADPKSMPS